MKRSKKRVEYHVMYSGNEYNASKFPNITRARRYARELRKRYPGWIGCTVEIQKVTRETIRVWKQPKSKEAHV